MTSGIVPPGAAGKRAAARSPSRRPGEASLAAYLVRGDDPALVGAAVRRLLASLVGDGDAALTVEEHGGPDAADLDVGALVDALATRPFLAERRIVVARDAGRLDAPGAARLARCIADPVPGVVLVLVAGGGTVPATLVKLVDALGGLVDTSVGSGRARTQWLVDRLHDAPVRLDARAATMLGDHLGGDLGRLGGLLDVLVSAYGPGAGVGTAELEPFLGEEGTAAPWDLTDAIDQGDTVGALVALRRLLGAGGQHPLVVLGSLHRHYRTMLCLDGAAVSSPEEGAKLVGARSVYPVKKAMEQGRRLGSARLGRAVVLLAEADLDLRGRTALPDAAVLEVLVARLSRLGGAGARARRPGARS